MIPDLTLEERVNYIKNHFEELFKDTSYCPWGSKRNVEIFLERFLEKTTLQKLGDKHDLTRDRIRQIEVKVKRKIERSGLFSFWHKPPEEPAILGNTPIARLELNIRAENCLRAENVRTIGALLLLSECDLLKIPNLGRKSLKEIKAALAGEGLCLRS